MKAGITSETQAQLVDEVIGRLQIWIVVTSNEDKKLVEAPLVGAVYPVGVFSLDDVKTELENLGRIGA